MLSDFEIVEQQIGERLHWKIVERKIRVFIEGQIEKKLKLY